MTEEQIDKAVRAVLEQIGYSDPDRALAGKYAPYQHARDIVEAVFKTLENDDEIAKEV